MIIVLYRIRYSLYFFVHLACKVIFCWVNILVRMSIVRNTMHQMNICSMPSQFMILYIMLEKMINVFANRFLSNNKSMLVWKNTTWVVQNITFASGWNFLERYIYKVQSKLVQRLDNAVMFTGLLYEMKYDAKNNFFQVWYQLAHLAFFFLDC